MDAILQGLSGIFEVAVIAGLGFFLSRMGFFWESAGKDLTKFTMSVALPPLMIYSLYSNFTHDQLIETAPDMLLPFASIFVAYLAGRVLAKVLNITKSRRGVFTCTCCIANAIFIGLPVNMALFGEASVPSCMLYYIANTAMFWFLGAYLIVKDAGGDHKFTVKEMLLKLRTPPLMGFITGVLLILLNIPLPHFLLRRKYRNADGPYRHRDPDGAYSVLRDPSRPRSCRRDVRALRPFTALPFHPAAVHSGQRDVREGLPHAGRHAGYDEHDDSRQFRRRRC